MERCVAAERLTPWTPQLLFWLLLEDSASAAALEPDATAGRSLLYCLGPQFAKQGPSSKLTVLTNSAAAFSIRVVPDHAAELLQRGNSLSLQLLLTQLCATAAARSQAIACLNWELSLAYALPWLQGTEVSLAAGMIPCVTAALNSERSIGFLSACLQHCHPLNACWSADQQQVWLQILQSVRDAAATAQQSAAMYKLLQHLGMRVASVLTSILKQDACSIAAEDVVHLAVITLNELLACCSELPAAQRALLMPILDTQAVLGFAPAVPASSKPSQQIQDFNGQSWFQTCCHLKARIALLRFSSVSDQPPACQDSSRSDHMQNSCSHSCQQTAAWPQAWQKLLQQPGSPELSSAPDANAFISAFLAIGPDNPQLLSDQQHAASNACSACCSEWLSTQAIARQTSAFAAWPAECSSTPSVAYKSSRLCKGFSEADVCGVDPTDDQHAHANKQTCQAIDQALGFQPFHPLAMALQFWSMLQTAAEQLDRQAEHDTILAGSPEGNFSFSRHVSWHVLIGLLADACSRVSLPHHQALQLEALLAHGSDTQPVLLLRDRLHADAWVQKCVHQGLVMLSNSWSAGEVFSYLSFTFVRSVILSADTLSS